MSWCPPTGMTRLAGAGNRVQGQNIIKENYGMVSERPAPHGLQMNKAESAGNSLTVLEYQMIRMILHHWSWIISAPALQAKP